MTRRYGHAGRAGCVQLRRARQTGTMVGIYHNDQAGLDSDDGAYPFSTVCEDHGCIIVHETLTRARHHAPDPLGWCDGCREEEERNPRIRKPAS